MIASISRFTHMFTTSRQQSPAKVPRVPLATRPRPPSHPRPTPTLPPHRTHRIAAEQTHLPWYQSSEGQLLVSVGVGVGLGLCFIFLPALLSGAAVALLLGAKVLQEATRSEMPLLPPMAVEPCTPDAAVDASIDAGPGAGSYLEEMRRSTTFATQLEAQALSMVYRCQFVFWTRREDGALRYVDKTNSPDGQPVLHILNIDSVHFRPLVNLQGWDGRAGSDAQVSGDDVEVGGDGNCLFYSVAYLLDPSRRRPTYKAAQALRHQACERLAQPDMAHVLEDLNFLAANAPSAGYRSD